MRNFINFWYVSPVGFGISVTFIWDVKNVYIFSNEEEHNKYRVSITDF
jgi:hypothetical protein